MPTYCEVLPPSKSNPNAAIRWTPAERDYEPVAGVLTICGKRDVTEYRVCEFPTGWQGRGFLLEKLGDGTDAEAEGYACFVPRDARAGTCECRGFLRWGHCKHLAAIEACVENGWL